MIKIAVLISGGGTNLQALIDAQEAGIIKNGKIELVVSSNPSAFGLVRAEKADIKTLTIENGKNRELFCGQLKQALISSEIGLVVLAGFMLILTESFVKSFENRIINVHPSLIPSFCGAGHYGLRVHEKALEYGVKVTGATVHFVNEICDAGEIIMQKAVDVLPGDTPELLQKRVMEQAEWVILPQAVEKICKEICYD